MLNSHTHCQVAQADPQTKTWQRVCLPQRTDKEKNNEGTTSATCQVRQQWFSVGIFPPGLLFGLTGIENQQS
jgi:hypothetical protein